MARWRERLQTLRTSSVSWPAPTHATRAAIHRIRLCFAGRWNEASEVLVWRGARTSAGFPLDPGVRSVLDAQRKTFESLGCIVEEAYPDLTDADSIFLTIRGFSFAASFGPLLAEIANEMKPEAIWNVESGLALSSGDVARAMMQHGQLLERVRRFQEKYEFISAP